MIQPIVLNGIWDEGYAIDKYLRTSTYIGDDAFGQPQFDNSYTEIGKLLHDMKYNGHFNTSREIALLCYDFLNEWLDDKNINSIIPVPATMERVVQPVYAIAEEIAHRLHLPYSQDVLKKTSDIPVKNMPRENRNLKGSVTKLKDAKWKCNILLIDDFYTTGETATECVSVLKEDNLIDKIYYLSIVKTKQK